MNLFFVVAVDIHDRLVGDAGEPVSAAATGASAAPVVQQVRPDLVPAAEQYRQRARLCRADDAVCKPRNEAFIKSLQSNLRTCDFYKTVETEEPVEERVEYNGDGQHVEQFHAGPIFLVGAEREPTVDRVQQERPG